MISCQIERLYRDHGFTRLGFGTLGFMAQPSLPTKPGQYRGQGAHPRRWLLSTVGSGTWTAWIVRVAAFCKEALDFFSESSRGLRKGLGASGDGRPSTGGALEQGRGSRRDGQG
jgi:hypothetical protein